MRSKTVQRGWLIHLLLLLTLSTMPGAMMPGSVTREVMAAPERPAERAKEFRLEDQFGRTLHYRFPKKKVSVLTFGDWQGSKQVEGWVRPIYQRFGGSIDIHGVAVLSALPSIFRDFVRGQFAEKIKYPVLLDWEGDVSEGYGYQSDSACLVVIAPSGEIVLRICGAATPARLKRVSAEIERLTAVSAQEGTK